MPRVDATSPGPSTTHFSVIDAKGNLVAATITLNFYFGSGLMVPGTGILLIDHDVALVLDVCDYIYVLDFGRVIAEGDPAAIRANRDVADAYLGHAHDATTTTTTSNS